MNNEIGDDISLFTIYSFLVSRRELVKSFNQFIKINIELIKYSLTNSFRCGIMYTR